MCPVNKRVNRRGAATREAAIDAAIALWAESGWRVTRLSAIAERIGVTDAAVLHHFGSKEAFLLAVLAELDRRNTAHWQSWIGDGGLATLRRLPDLARYIAKHPEPYKLHLRLQVDNLDPGSPAYEHERGRHLYNQQAFAGIVATGQERGEIRSDVDPELVAGQIVAVLNGMVLHREHGPEHVDPVAICVDFTDRLVRDLATDPA
jgi:AcrR family transcriptional regulator